MFETTTQFDFDDDVALETSFTPTPSTSSMSAIAQKRNVEEDLNKEDSLKKLNVIVNSGTTVNRSLIESLSIQRYISNDSVGSHSPSRVLKRKFPGPAGLLPETAATNKSILQLLEDEKLENDETKDMPILSQQTCSVFKDGPWSEMSKDFHIPNGQSLFEQFNIRWIKRHAFKLLLSYKAPFLAAVIHNLDIIDGKVPTINVVLKDATGDIRGTILHSLYEAYASYIKIGSVVVLKQFGVLSVGYNNHCVTITPNNLISVYYPEGQISLFKKTQEGVYGQSNRNPAVKKVCVQSCETQEILKKYSVDIEAYSREKSMKVNFGNLYRNDSNAGAIKNNLLLGNKLSPNMNETKRVLSNNKYASSNTKTVRKMSSTSTGEWMKKCDINENSKLTNKESRVENETCDKVVISTSQISVKPDNKDHAEIWKNLLEDVDTDSLFGDF